MRFKYVSIKLIDGVTQRRQTWGSFLHVIVLLCLEEKRCGGREREREEEEEEEEENREQGGGDKRNGGRKWKGREGNRKRKRKTPLLQGRQDRATVKEMSFSAPSSDWGLRCPNSQLVATASTLMACTLPPGLLGSSHVH